MRFYADLHVHSRYSRATSKQCDLVPMAAWGLKKGLSLLATGDVTHPAWRANLRESLVEAEPGLFRLVPESEAEVMAQLPAACQGRMRFILSGEISTIYKKGDKTRKIHHLVILPDMASLDRLVAALDRVGNLASDGRPILGLDSRDLLEMVLESGEHSYLVPAHIWTPWFAALGSRSGFDSIRECYGDLADHIFAVETGLSSDPPMNWMVSSLDRYRLISSSDAHSPQKLGREACIFDTRLDFFALREALETGRGYVGTVEFFPEEGKYHLDGHRKCQVRLTPAQTRSLDGLCPRCGRPLTVGVMHRVQELADRPPGQPPPSAGLVRSLVPLPELLSEILGVGAGSKTVARAWSRLVDSLGPELPLLDYIPTHELASTPWPQLQEALDRLRRGQVLKEGGYDGEYGVVRLFTPQELKVQRGGNLLFQLPGRHGEGSPSALDAGNAAPGGIHGNHPGAAREPPQRGLAAPPDRAPPHDVQQGLFAASSGVLQGLDPKQRLAARVVDRHLLIIAGPGSGKTRTLTHRIAHLVLDLGVSPSRCLAIAFTRRAAQELEERLHSLLRGARELPRVATFHSLGLSIIREWGSTLGLPARLSVASDPERQEVLLSVTGWTLPRVLRTLKEISLLKRRGAVSEDSRVRAAMEAYASALMDMGRLDLDDLVGMAADILQQRPGLAQELCRRYPYVSVDEYQDLDQQQYRLTGLLVGKGRSGSRLCAIGDPNQAIYGFRGASPQYFGRFTKDFPGAAVVRLSRNYRSGRCIVHASDRLMEASMPGRPPSLPQALHSRRIILGVAPSHGAEAEQVVHGIERLMGGHGFFSMDSGRVGPAPEMELSFSDFAILFRSAELAGPLEEALSRSGMPFQRRSHEPLRHLPLLEPLLDGMKVALDGGPGLEEALLAAAAELESGGKRRADAEPGCQVHRDLAMLPGTVEMLRPMARACGDDLDRFLTWTSTAVQVDTWDPRADRISLLTMHAAKGLEFRVVFIIGCEEGLLPMAWGDPSALEPAQVEEERRLFFVAITRARDLLFLMRARRRLLRGRVVEASPSRFLSCIGERYTQHQESSFAGRGDRSQERQLSLFGG